jgi:hypothetical protein
MADSSLSYMTAEERAAYEQVVENRRTQHSVDPESYGDTIGGDLGWLEKGDVAPKGVHALYPGCTPKYRTSIEGATETMARLLVPLTGYRARERFLASVPKGQTRELAQAIAVDSAEPIAGERGNLGYIDFILQVAQESYEEKVQVVDTLSDNYVAYFFGQNPPVFQYQGKLLNTFQDDWRAAFTLLYGEIMRGTKLARRRRLITLTYDNVAVTGSVVNMNQTLTADMEMAADFTFGLLVKRYDVYRLPETTFNPPAGFPSKLIDPDTFGGFRLGRVKRTFRQVGTPQYATSEPKKDQGKTEEEKEKLESTPVDPAEQQAVENIRNFVGSLSDAFAPNVQGLSEFVISFTEQ